MSLATFNTLPLELVYTILAHAVGHNLFQYLFLDVYSVQSATNDALLELCRFASVNKAWRSVLCRVLGALLGASATTYRSDSICRAVSSGVPSLNTAANRPAG